MCLMYEQGSVENYFQIVRLMVQKIRYVLKSKNVSKQRSSTANLKNQHSRNHVAVSAVVENSPHVKVSVCEV